MDLIEFDLFYDYNCPFVYRSAQMLEIVRASGEREVQINWRFFSLSQVNYRPESGDDAWTVWGARTSEPVQGPPAPSRPPRPHAARVAFDDIHISLLRSASSRPLDLEIAAGGGVGRAASGLDLDRFRTDVADPTILETLERDHLEARTRHGVFGTPTYVFPGGGARTFGWPSRPQAADAVRIFDRIVAVAPDEPSILEIKRPVRPTPD